MQVDDILLSAVRQGDVDLLETHLSTVINPELYLNRVYEETEEKKCTPMMIACLNGHTDVIRMVLHRFKPNLEILNNIRLDEVNTRQHMFLDVTLLWAAASINNFDIVKLLVEHGANVNHRTKTNSTPLRGACYNGNIEMARYLIKNGGDIHIPKENNETNLMASVCHGHLNMVIYLVDELGFDVNDCNNDGNSSLYYAVISDSLELVKFLLNRGARIFPATRDQMSPLVWAAERRRSDLVDAFFPYCSLLEQIEALELLGSACICAPASDRNVNQAFEYFRRAFELRSAHNIPKLLKYPTIPIFNHRRECQTLDQFEELHSDFDNTYFEALLVRERLLGPTNEEYHYSIFYRGALLADNGQYSQAIDYWIYELDLRRQYSITLDWTNLRCFGSLFSEMLRKSISVPIDALLKIMMVTIEELDHHKEGFNNNLYTLLFLITITIQTVTKTTISDADRKRINHHLYTINQRNYRTMDGERSLLHLSLDEHISTDDYDIKYICKYPCLQTTRILLQYGADVNVFDAVRNTPLHVFISNQSSFDESILKLLYEFGAHPDYANALGEIPLDLATNPTIKQLLKSQMEIRLKCLCARLIQKSNIPFHEKIFTSLANFVEKH